MLKEAPVLDIDIAAETTLTDTLANVWPAVGAGCVLLFRFCTNAAEMCCCDLCQTCVVQASNEDSSLRLIDGSACNGKGTHI